MRNLSVSALILISLCGTSSISANLKKCPNWVQQAGRCAPFLRIIKDANEYRIILKKDYKIVSAKYENEYIFVHIKRHSLVSEIKVGRFQLIKRVVVEDGLVIITYDKTQVVVEDASWTEIFIAGGSGFIVGVLVVAVIILL